MPNEELKVGWTKPLVESAQKLLNKVWAVAPGCSPNDATIGLQKRKILADYYSRSDDPDSRAAQNIFRGLTARRKILKI